MAGIAGIFHPGLPKPVEPARVAGMAAALAHRGPAGQGVWTAAGIGLAHRRPDGGDEQPFRDGELVLVYDGELRNAAEWRSELSARGAAIRSGAWPELLLHGWRFWGPAMLDRLSGAFALALYDGERRMLFLARDRLGERPLHYTELADGSVAFASELKGLLAHPLLRRQPDLRAVEDYLALGYVPDDACLLAGVHKLGAGRWLMIERGRDVVGPRRWWRPDFTRRAAGSSAGLCDELLDRMRTAVRSRMDGGTGAFLTDEAASAAVVALMAEASRPAVTTVSAGTGANTRAVAERFRTAHYPQPVRSPPWEALDRMTAAFDEPFADPEALVAMDLAVAARRYVSSMLAGDGADEVTGGHERYRAHWTAERVRALMPPVWRQPLFGRVRSLAALGLSSGDAYGRAVSLTAPDLRARLLSARSRRLLAGYRPEDRYVAAMAEAPGRDALDRAQYADLTLAVPAGALTRLDRTGMAAGLPVRAPMLDAELVTFCASLPSSVRLGRKAGLSLMGRVFREHLPVEILRRRAAPPPLDAWFHGPLAETAAALPRSPGLAATGWFDVEGIADLVARHRAGRGEHGRTLWQLLVLERSLARLLV